MWKISTFFYSCSWLYHYMEDDLYKKFWLLTSFFRITSFLLWQKFRVCCFDCELWIVTLQMEDHNYVDIPFKYSEETFTLILPNTVSINTVCAVIMYVSLHHLIVLPILLRNRLTRSQYSLIQTNTIRIIRKKELT